MPILRAVVVIDYQNVHLVGAGIFAPEDPKHEWLVHPLLYANGLISARNTNQREGQPHAELSKVLVYRGLPSAENDPRPYALNLAQRTSWERDPRVTVTLRPLKYTYERTADGRKATVSRGRPIVTGKQEKGVDVLCALALVREARLADVDVVILASQDTDLEPALDEAIALRSAKIETASWFESGNYGASHEIRPTTHRIWNTRLDGRVFAASRDSNRY